MEKSTVSVLLATHNSEKYIREQLDSLLTQTYKDITITVSDDNSTDKTVEILNEYAKKDRRILILNNTEKFGSAQANFMFLLKKAKENPYYMFCDHDDKWLKNKVELTLNKMREIEEENLPCLVYTDLFVVDNSFNIIGNSMFSMQKLNKKNALNEELIQNNVTGCTTMINFPLRQLAVKKSDTNNMIMHDWFLGILALGCGKSAFADISTIYYRQHGNNTVGAKDVSSSAYIFNKAKDKSGNRLSLINTMKQAQMIADLYKDELKDNYKIVFEYGNMLNKNKFGKLLICAKYGFWKNTFLRKIGQILYI